MNKENIQHIQKTQQSITKKPRSSLEARFGEEPLRAHKGALDSYVRRTLRRSLSPKEEHEFLLASLSTGLFIDGIQAHLTPQGERFIFVAAYEGLLKIFEKSYKSPLQVTCYYPCQTDILCQQIKYKENLPGKNFYTTLRDRNYRDNPSVVQVGYSKNHFINFLKEELDEKTKTVQGRGPWKHHKLEMYKKTAIKAFFKYLTTDNIAENLKNFLYNAEEDHSGNFN